MSGINILYSVFKIPILMIFAYTRKYGYVLFTVQSVFLINDNLIENYWFTLCSCLGILGI